MIEEVFKKIGLQLLGKLLVCINIILISIYMYNIYYLKEQSNIIHVVWILIIAQFLINYITIKIFKNCESLSNRCNEICLKLTQEPNNKELLNNLVITSKQLFNEMCLLTGDWYLEKKFGIKKDLK